MLLRTVFPRGLLGEFILYETAKYGVWGQEPGRVGAGTVLIPSPLQSGILGAQGANPLSKQMKTLARSPLFFPLLCL